MSILERCLSYRESNKGGKERQGPTLGVSFRGVRLIDGQIKVVKKGRNQLYVSVKRESTEIIVEILFA